MEYKIFVGTNGVQNTSAFCGNKFHYFMGANVRTEIVVHLYSKQNTYFMLNYILQIKWSTFVGTNFLEYKWNTEFVNHLWVQ